MAADLEDPQARDRLVDDVVDRLGRIDILVNNAGYADYALVEDMSLDTFDRTVEHHLRVPFVLDQGGHTAYASPGRRLIVNLGSVTGLSPLRPYRDYKSLQVT